MGRYTPYSDDTNIHGPLATIPIYMNLTRADPGENGAMLPPPPKTVRGDTMSPPQTQLLPQNIGKKYKGTVNNVWVAPNI